MELHSLIIESDRFTWRQESRSLVAEHSDLFDVTGRGKLTLARLYDDAADEGFTMRSARTGELVNFGFHHGDTDDAGEVTHWTYTPVPEAVRRNPALKGVKVVILND